jgi:hypothetical protein
MIRFSAFHALVAVSYIEQHGGHYTQALGKEVSEAWIASTTAGSGVPNRYPDMQYFLGEDVWLDPDLFAARLKELEEKYAPPA